MNEQEPAIVDSNEIPGFEQIDPADLRETDVLADVFGGRKPIHRIFRHERKGDLVDVIQVVFTDGEREPFLAGDVVTIHTRKEG